MTKRERRSSLQRVCHDRSGHECEQGLAARTRAQFRGEGDQIFRLPNGGPSRPETDIQNASATDPTSLDRGIDTQPSTPGYRVQGHVRSQSMMSSSCRRQGQARRPISFSHLHVKREDPSRCSLDSCFLLRYPLLPPGDMPPPLDTPPCSVTRSSQRPPNPRVRDPALPSRTPLGAHLCKSW